MQVYLFNTTLLWPRQVMDGCMASRTGAMDTFRWSGGGGVSLREVEHNNKDGVDLTLEMDPAVFSLVYF